MMPLILARLAVGAEKIGDGRTTHQDSFFQDVLKPAMQSCELFPFQCTSKPRGMDLRAPQALVRIDIADAAQEALIEKERFDSRPAGSRLLNKLVDSDFERISAKGTQFLGERPGS